MNDLLQRLTGLRITRPNNPVGEPNDTEEPINIPVADVPEPNAPVINNQPFIMPAPQLPIAQLPVVQLPVAQLPVVQLPVVQLPVAQLPIVAVPVVVGVQLIEEGNHLADPRVRQLIANIPWTPTGQRFQLRRHQFRTALNNAQSRYSQSNVRVIIRDLTFLQSIVAQDRRIGTLTPPQLQWLRDIQERVAN